MNAKIPLAAAAIAPTTNAGMLPPPNNASHGPLATDTTICGTTIARFRTPSESPCPAPELLE
ncbi:hypothetical protein ABTG41_18365 [Acinetobacter baumannii]